MLGSKSFVVRYGSRSHMRMLVTGSSGHLGEALARSLLDLGHEVIGLDVVEGAYTNRLGSICDRALVRRCMAGVSTVFHPATLHKPHVATHSRQDFLDVNLSGTLNLLEEAVTASNWSTRACFAP